MVFASRSWDCLSGLLSFKLEVVRSQSFIYIANFVPSPKVTCSLKRDAAKAMVVYNGAMRSSTLFWGG